MKNHSNFFLVVSCILAFTFLFKNVNAQQTLVNTKHLDHLYEEINIDGNKLGIVHIYCEYPDYNWVDDSDEGIACVDDVSRAAIFYMNYSSRVNDAASNEKAKKLIEFVLHMQSENGFFYNFIFPDFSINKTHQNSIAEPNWWSWRALLSLTEAYAHFKDADKEFSARVESAIRKTIAAAKKHFLYEKRIVDLNGFNRPAWLPFQYASDQAALIVTALCKYNFLFEDNSVLNLINDFCEGILLMQEGNDNEFPFYAFMSWENSWHAWGNSQSYSLLCAYEITGNKKYLASALNEINYFYKYLLKEKFLNEFAVKKEIGKTVLDSEKKFAQIAYGITPMIYAVLKAAELTKDKKYPLFAAEIAEWFFGKNPADAKIYFEQTGICYDGIINEKEINKNSGAESTIEALLSLLAIEGNVEASCTLKKIIEGKK
ncbi:MAG: hypothetical protein HYS25_09890 [Ignavibacteriales bacterium]|nr:hypothetical protein [Ignavibacteriales bacterium]